MSLELAAFIVSYVKIWKFAKIISFVCWMAGLFYLPRIFVYQVSSPAHFSPTFSLMALRLYTIIIRPACFSAWIFGMLLCLAKQTWREEWFYYKIFCVGALTVYQFLLNQYRRELDLSLCTKNHVFFRVLNEVPTLFLFLIVYFSVFKPSFW